MWGVLWPKAELERHRMASKRGVSKKKKRMKRLEKESVERGDGRHSIEKSDEGKDKVNLG